MIKRLRNRFIRIAMLSVTAVMLLLTIILNVANYISTDSDLKQTLTLIYENAGTIPHSRFQLPDSADAPTPPENDGGSGDIAPALPDDADDSRTPQAPPDDKIARREGPFTAETPFSTRFFVLHYTSSGTLTQADLDNIASVTEDDTQEYLSAALAHGAGYGYFNSYRFFVAQTDDGENIAIFLDCYHELRAMRVVLMWSLLADAACILLVFLLVVLLSRRAIDPVVRSAQQQKQFITDASGVLVSAALAGAAVWGGYEVTTRVMLKNLLPEGTAIPATRGELAQLLWNAAGRPEAGAVVTVYPDITDADQQAAARWCTEQGLLTARSDGTFAPDGRVPKWRVIEVWNKAFARK